MITLFFTKALEFYKNSDFDNPRKLNALEVRFFLNTSYVSDNINRQ